uniref:SFRICE_034927 n=1 Tax=Spodoptera frugiperda TaxID=7108 RepID=A0A2H1WZJ0_SPOFR
MGDTEPLEKDETKTEIPNLVRTTSHGYFHGHACHLSAAKLSAYELKCRGVRKWLFNIITVHAGDIRAINMHRSYAALCAEKFRHYQHFRYTIHPYSKLRFYLEFLFVFLMIVSSIVQAFHYAENNGDYVVYHAKLLMFSDSMIIVNIIVNFFTGYIEGYSRKVSVLSKKKIAWKYLTTWLVLDVVACFAIPISYDTTEHTIYMLLEAMKLVRLPIIMVYLQNVLTVMKASESRMLGCVSGQLREDILMHTGRQLVRELEFLKQLPSSLLVQIAFKLRVVIYIAGDIIFKINTVGDCLYFIDRGTVAIYSDSGKEICHLEDGDFFGEIALVMKHHFRTASAIAVTNCELFRLDREHFDATIAYYPTVYNSIKEVATSRFERTCVLDEHHKAELRTAEESER